MEKPGEMTTLTRVLEKLHERGFDHELKMSDHGRLQNSDAQKIYDPEDLTIIKTYRFEGESDPGDSSILYVMEDKEGEKGYVIDTYGVYATDAHDATFDEFIKKIKVEDREEQLIYA